MAHSNGRITAPIGIDSDIGPVLGVASTDLGTLCLSDRVNKWSKYKPVVGGLAGSQIKDIYTNSNCSLRIPTATSIQACVNLAEANNYDWAYIKPDTWYRALDFEGYNHNARNPSACGTPAGTILQKTGAGASFNFGDDLVITDFPNMSPTFGSATNMYFGVAILYGNNPAIKGWMTAASTIKDGGYTIKIPVNSLDLNTNYRAMAFLSGSVKPDWLGGATGTNEFLYLPQAPTTFKVIDTLIRVSIGGQLSFSTKILTFSLTADNKSDTTVNVTGTFKIKYVGREPNTAMMPGEIQGNLAVLIAEANKVSSKDYTFRNVGNGQERMYIYANPHYEYGGQLYSYELRANLIMTT